MNDVGPFQIQNPSDALSRPKIPRFAHMPPQFGHLTRLLAAMEWPIVVIHRQAIDPDIIPALHGFL